MSRKNKITFNLGKTIKNRVYIFRTALDLLKSWEASREFPIINILH